MQSEPLVFVGCCDLAGIVRGKGFPAAELEHRLVKGVGLTHSNIMMSAFGPIYRTPFGTLGDLMLVPDPATRVEVAFDGGAAERFYLGDIRNTDGSPWECCPRHFLRRALAALEETAGLSLLAAFEQEFVYTGVEERPGATYALDAWRRRRVRRGLHGGVARRRAQARQLPAGIRSAAIRGDGRADRRAEAGGRGGDPARDGARRRPPDGPPRDLCPDPRPRRHRQRHPHPFQPARPRRRAGIV